MPTFALKRYQQQALVALERYLRAARLHGAAAGFTAETGLGYHAEPFGAVPCVCLRIPTGGGKTLLAAHAVGRMARDWPPVTAQPLALWLVPSDTIRTQTLAALATPGHPFREALAEACGADVRVCDLEQVATLAPQDFDAHAVVVVATIQSFRVEDTDQRNAYAFSEALEPHFRGLPPAALDALRALPDAVVTAAEADAARAGREMLARFVGRPRWSLANWLALRCPYVIVDEAHNAKTERSFEALKRLNPTLILELTATPVPKRTNVLFHVSAQQLQAEAMIKMPIVLREHTRGWQEAVIDAVQNQRLLEAEAQQEEVATAAYIRPIVLLQAQNEGQPVSVDVLRAFLLDELHLPEAQVKVATGTKRELEGVDLNARDCAVRYIVTVQALREGWDCPFAYILCTVRGIRSATAVEQLLGRVLRMPYAARRTREALNKAYAHVTEAETGLAANALADRLVQGLGFEALDIASMVAPQLPIDLGRDDGPLFRPAMPPLPVLSVDLPADTVLPAAVQEAVDTGAAQVSRDGERLRVLVRGSVPEAVGDALVAAQKGKRREEVARQIAQQNALVAAARAPASRGVAFAAVPRLCVRAQGELQLVEREAVLAEEPLNLLQPGAVALPGFSLVEQPGALWEVYLDGQRVRVGRGTEDQLSLDDVPSTVNDEDLARWLARELQHPSRNVARDVLPAHLRAFVLACVRHLVHDRRIPFPQLVRHQVPLMQQLAARIADLRDAAANAAFRQCVLDGGWPLETSAERGFRFDAGIYPVPAHKRYTGRFAWAKHYYPVVADLVDGGEEWRCAVAIDQHPRVRHWVRNLDSDPVAGFWLPTSFGRFYPDFVVERDDGVLCVVEYKGAHLRDAPREIEKGQVGRVWAERSGGRCRFAMVFVVDEAGRNVAQQVAAAIETP